jgi:small redox-active disulfide protein 2
LGTRWNASVPGYGSKFMKKLHILGGGCAKCHELADRAAAAAKELGLEFELEKVSDLQRIMGYGVMRTPALVVDGAVKVAGRVPSVEEIKELLG